MAMVSREGGETASAATSPVDFVTENLTNFVGTPGDRNSTTSSYARDRASVALDMDLGEITDNLSVASAGDVNNSDSSHFSSHLLKLDTKGCIGFFERLPLYAKIIFLVLFYAIGLAIVSAFSIALSADVLSNTRSAADFISQGKVISKALYAIQRERKAATLMMVSPSVYELQDGYLKTISATDLELGPFEAMLTKNKALYGSTYTDYVDKKSTMNELRAKTTARLLPMSEMSAQYQAIVQAVIILIHRSNKVLGYNYDMTMLGLYNEYNEATIQTYLASVTFADPSTRAEYLPQLAFYVGERTLAQRALLNSGKEEAITIFKSQVIDNPLHEQFVKNVNEIISKDSGYSFTYDQYIGTAVEFLETFELSNSQAMFAEQIQSYIQHEYNQSAGIISAVVVVVVAFAVLSLTNSILFARSIVGPWKRLNAMQEATIAKFVPKGFLSFMGWKSISQAKLGSCLEQDATIVIVKIAQFSKLEENMKDSQQFYDFINTFLAYIGPFVRSNKGFIDKFSSDHFVAIFHKDKRALKAALEIQQAVPTFNKLQLQTISLIISIVSGKTVMGTIGENERMESVSLSKTMKAARKLLKIAKRANATILTTKETLKSIPQLKGIPSRYIGNIKTKPTSRSSYDLCELLSFDEQIAKYKSREQFSKAVCYMQQSRFQEAFSILDPIAESNPGDLLAVKYRDLTKQAVIDNVNRLSKLSVSEVLNDVALHATLEQLCNQEHSAENINLWNRIQLYKRTHSAEERKHLANSICDDFLQIDGSQPVNLSAEQVSSVRRVVKNVNNTSWPPQLFSGIEILVEQLMLDTLKRLKTFTQFKQVFLGSSFATKLDEINL